MNNFIFNKKFIKCEEIKTDNIPLCNTCLFELKDGNYVCKDCRMNICDAHVESHKTHNLLKLIKQ
jgi:hypothetical protein